MKRTAFTSKDPDILGSAPALRRAARRALELGIETQTPVYILREGRIVDLTQEAGVPQTRQQSKARRKRQRS